MKPNPNHWAYLAGLRARDEARNPFHTDNAAFQWNAGYNARPVQKERPKIVREKRSKFVEGLGTDW